MGWQEVFIHIGNFLLLPLFVGCTVGALARFFCFKHCSYTILMLAGTLGSLAGLITAWIFTGHDGHMLGYGLLILLCSAFICITAGKMPKRSNPGKK